VTSRSVSRSLFEDVPLTRESHSQTRLVDVERKNKKSNGGKEGSRSPFHSLSSFSLVGHVGTVFLGNRRGRDGLDVGDAEVLHQVEGTLGVLVDTTGHGLSGVLTDKAVEHLLTTWVVLVPVHLGVLVGVTSASGDRLLEIKNVVANDAELLTSCAPLLELGPLHSLRSSNLLR